jgi:hypothetical protein
MTLHVLPLRPPAHLIHCITRQKRPRPLTSPRHHWAFFDGHCSIRPRMPSFRHSYYRYPIKEARLGPLTWVPRRVALVLARTKGYRHGLLRRGGFKQWLESEGRVATGSLQGSITLTGRTWELLPTLLCCRPSTIVAQLHQDGRRGRCSWARTMRDGDDAAGSWSATKTSLDDTFSCPAPQHLLWCVYERFERLRAGPIVCETSYNKRPNRE